MTVDEANHANTVGSSWRRVVSLLEQDHRVSPRQRGFVILAQAQGLIGSTLLVAVPNELTREVLQTQVKDALDDALHNVFSEDIRCAMRRPALAFGTGPRGSHEVDCPSGGGLRIAASDER